MKRIGKYIVYMLTGIGIGSIASTFSIAALGGMNDTIRQVLVWLAASAAFTALSLIYHIDFGSLLLKTAVHFALCFLLAVTAGRFLQYFTSWTEGVKEMLPLFFIIYAAIYVIIYVSSLMEAKELNKKLSQ